MIFIRKYILWTKVRPRVRVFTNLLPIIYISAAFACVPTSESFAQADSILFKFQNSIPYPIESFTVNNLGEFYIINTSNQLKKLNDKGDSIGVFNQVTKYGKLSYVEAQNPWKTILFYE